MNDHLELVIITGMSGAGKTVAIQSFEDLGYYCVDNLPPSLLSTFWDLMKESGKITKIAIVIDLRTREFFDELQEAINQLDQTRFIKTKLIFLDAKDEVLVSRYKETRRNHPLARTGRILEGIKAERERLWDIRSRAQVVIDTSDLSPRELRQEIMEHFAKDGQELFTVEVLSFGFKYGSPIDADIVMDVRFLPNPHYIDELRPQTGLDKPVYDYVMKQAETDVFYHKFIDLLEYCLPGYRKEGKTILTVAIGCTGGKHRSVALVERIAKRLIDDNYQVNITHRDINKKSEGVNRS